MTGEIFFLFDDDLPIPAPIVGGPPSAVTMAASPDDAEQPTARLGAGDRTASQMLGYQRQRLARRRAQLGAWGNGRRGRSPAA